MIRLSRRAQRQLRDLVNHYRQRARGEAIANLQEAVDKAGAAIATGRAGGRRYPANYSELTAPGISWLRSGRYWIAFTQAADPMITGVYWDAAAIDRRHSETD